ncbi:sugar transferase [Microcoleus sp. OTE_8_concoct_300]|uniref:sugar transferase n=1 Tax=Microcoleus sp. OTE_8_concoct_300 TaxID=2964710 RepID=UPI00403F17AD
MYLHFGKRIFDLTIALLGLIILAVPMAVIAILIGITSGSPILFTQERVGKGGQIFYVKKFQTMSVRSVKDSSITVAGDSRVTAIGSYLRRWKLDELPQLWNVLVGEMSLVGPRPDVPGYADKLQGDDRKLLLLRPGITGPATLAYRNEEEILAKVSDPVQYNNEIIYPDKVRINLEYMENCSLMQDLKYILETMGGRSNHVAD